MRSVLLLAFALAGCAPEAEELEAYGEALVVVDTDLPVPRIVNRLRIDVYDSGGVWIDSRDVLRPRPEDWPVSFSIFSKLEGKTVHASLRLRAYSSGRVRDYLGERFSPRAVGGDPFQPAPLPPATHLPRLIRYGNDVTPSSEPQPLASVDRLVEVALVFGKRGAVRVVLEGACAGTMADLLGRSTCVDSENERESLAPAELDPDLDVPGTSLVGGFGAAVACSGTPRSPGKDVFGSATLDDEVCVPGGVFLFGSQELGGLGQRSATPERVVVVPPLFVDRYPVTVARFRDRKARGFVEPVATPFWDQPPGTSSDETPTSFCTLSSAPGIGGQDRESHPVNCVYYDTARAFCDQEGGALLTEVQREWVASAAERDHDTRYPWGDDDPSCERASYGRWDDVETASHQCVSFGFGPESVLAHAGPEGDVTPSIGIVNLGAGVSEWALDSFASLKDNCWAALGIHDPRCDIDNARARTARGATWRGFASNARSAYRSAKDSSASDIEMGFRCARAGTP